MGNTRPYNPRKPVTRWTADTENAFLLALRQTGQAKRAAAEIGRSYGAAQRRRLADPDFAARWDAALEQQQAEWIAATQTRLGPGLDAEGGGGRLTPGRARADGWDSRRRGLFLRTLARTKRVDAACAAAGMPAQAAHALRGRSPRFAAAWEKALRDAAPSVLDAAYARAVEGWDEPILQGGKVVGQRRRYSEGLLRDLLKGELGRGSRGGERGRAAAQEAADDPVRARAVAEVAPLLKQKDPVNGCFKNAAQRHAYEVAKAAGGFFTQAALPEETDAAILKKIEMMDVVRARERQEREEAEWARWRRGWGAVGGCAGRETM